MWAWCFRVSKSPWLPIFGRGGRTDGHEMFVEGHESADPEREVSGHDGDEIARGAARRPKVPTVSFLFLVPSS